MRIRGTMDKIEYDKLAALVDKIEIRLARTQTPKVSGRQLSVVEQILVTEAHRAVNAWLYENPGY